MSLRVKSVGIIEEKNIVGFCLLWIISGDIWKKCKTFADKYATLDIKLSLMPRRLSAAQAFVDTIMFPISHIYTGPARQGLKD